MAATTPRPRIRVAGMAIDNDQLLVINHRREGQSYYLLPGGGLEWGETFEQGVKREFLEELSLHVKVGSLLCVNESISPDQKRHIIHLTFKVEVMDRQQLKVNVDERVRGAEWMDKQQFESTLFYPEIKQHLLKVWDKRDSTGACIIQTPWR